MINLGVVAAIRAVGVRGDPCGAMRCIFYDRFDIQGGLLLLHTHKSIYNHHD